MFFDGLTVTGTTSNTSLGEPRRLHQDSPVTEIGGITPPQSAAQQDPLKKAEELSHPRTARSFLKPDLDFRAYRQCRPKTLSTSESTDVSQERKKKFRTLVKELEKPASEHKYRKRQITFELGVFTHCCYQWSTGDTLTAKPETIQRLKKFLVANHAG